MRPSNRVAGILCSVTLLGASWSGASARNLDDDAIRACVESSQANWCSQYTSIDKVQRVDVRDVPSGLEVLTNVWFEVKKPFHASLGDGGVALKCTGTIWDMDPSKVRTTKWPTGSQFVTGQRLAIATTLRFRASGSGDLMCVPQRLTASKSWYAK